MASSVLSPWYTGRAIRSASCLFCSASAKSGSRRRSAGTGGTARSSKGRAVATSFVVAGFGVEEADGAMAEALGPDVEAVPMVERSAFATVADGLGALFASEDGGTHAVTTRHVPTPIQLSHRFMSSLRAPIYTRMTPVSRMFDGALE